MGVFQKIRDNSALALIVIGGAIAAFVLTDLGKSFTQGGSNASEYVGSIEGEDISIEDFNTSFEKVAEIQGRSASNLNDREKEQLSNLVWNSVLLSNKLYSKEYEKVGIAVTNEEIEQMVGGELVSQFFVNNLFGARVDQGRYYSSIREDLYEDPSNFAQLCRKFDPVTGQAYSLSEGEIRYIIGLGSDLKRQEKYAKLVQKCFVNTTSLAKDEYTAKYTKKDVSVGKIPYYLVADSLVEISDKEIRAYYNQNKEQFKIANASKTLQIGSFKLNATLEDDDEISKWANETVEDFKSDEDAELFVIQESDNAYDANYYAKGTGLGDELDTVLFSKPVGTVYGPYKGYKDGKQTYNIAKIIDSKQLADSVKVSRINIDFFKKLNDFIEKNPASKDNQEVMTKEYQSYVAKADSFYTLLEASPRQFGNMAAGISDDTTSAKEGGNIGWIKKGSPVNPAILDSAINGKKGDLFKIPLVNQQGQVYGYDFIIVNNYGVRQQKLQVAQISKKVEPGKKTLNTIYNNAAKVAQDLQNGNSLKSVKETGYATMVIDSVEVAPFQYALRNWEGGRKIIYWAFNEAQNGDAEVFKMKDYYLVVSVQKNQEEGFKPLSDNDVQATIKSRLIKTKKTEYIANKIGTVTENTVKDLPNLIPGSNVQVSTEVAVKTGVPNLAYESSLNGVIGGLAEGNTSGVIEGENSIFIVKVDKSTEAVITEDTNYDAEFNELKNQNAQANLMFEEMVKYKSEIKDNRQVIR